jgi:deoxycytidylate deaminase
MQPGYINKAIEIASQSAVICASHGAVVIHRGKIIGSGCNKYCIADKRKKRFSIHAEVSAIENALRKIPVDQLKKSTLIIVRINNDGDVLGSFPCENCRQYITNKGLKNVYYS